MEDKRVFQQGTMCEEQVRKRNQGTSSENNRRVGGRQAVSCFVSANQKQHSNRVGSPKHATPTDLLTCNSFLIYDLPPASIAPILVPQCLRSSFIISSRPWLPRRFLTSLPPRCFRCWEYR
ncbi:uncharacterized protein BDV14DRAFT_160805 [Aspergillus stella-maris]|uniref:uncharacterized protein n=1 Tax=Aspergillus stella-maris TaxID=1810926 RepID=UPI003CCD6294